MEAAVQGLAAIVINAYRGAAESRGARGTAGSGSGTRTLVDGLSLSMAHNHWLAVNHLDLHASLPLQIPDDDDDNEDGGRAGGGRGGRVGGTDRAEDGKGGGISRGFEAPPLDAAKVKWISRLDIDCLMGRAAGPSCTALGARSRIDYTPFFLVIAPHRGSKFLLGVKNVPHVLAFRNKNFCGVDQVVRFGIWDSFVC